MRGTHSAPFALSPRCNGTLYAIRSIDVMSESVKSLPNHPNRHNPLSTVRFPWHGRPRLLMLEMFQHQFHTVRVRKAPHDALTSTWSPTRRAQRSHTHVPLTHPRAAASNVAATDVAETWSTDSGGSCASDTDFEDFPDLLKDIDLEHCASCAPSNVATSDVAETWSTDSGGSCASDTDFEDLPDLLKDIDLEICKSTCRLLLLKLKLLSIGARRTHVASAAARV
eukprot:2105079-Prymnesium_polylepis.3